MQRDLSGVVGWHKNSFIDFPGVIATVLFFSGCNLRCPYCHNPHVVNARPGEEIDESAIWSFLKKRRKTIDGVVLSGGEPTLHECCARAAARMRDLGYRVKLDTNGLRPDLINAIRPDYLSVDVKTLPRLYKELCRSPYSDSEKRLSQSLAIAKSLGSKAEVRITCAHGFVSRDIIEELVPVISGVSVVFLQPMQNRVPLLDPAFADNPLVSLKDMELFRDMLSGGVERCAIRGHG